MANYIKTLQENVSVLQLNNAEQMLKINEFLKYLHSSKFHEDTTIQVTEVYDFLLNIRNDLNVQL